MTQETNRKKGNRIAPRGAFPDLLDVYRRDG